MNNLQYTTHKKLGLSLFIVYCLLSIGAPTIHAQSVDILWQGKGYTPPFFQGHTLWSKQSQIVFLAVPQGLGDPTKLDYLWSKNGTVLGNISGVGKNSLKFVDTPFSKPITIKVEIVEGEETFLADASVTLTPTLPYLSIYEESPLYGVMFNREINAGFAMSGEEITFASFPMFFNAQTREDSNLLYKWGGQAGKSFITYRAPGGTVGSSQVSLSATTQGSVLQSASRSFLVQFGNNENK